jgi:hypothetical protein
MLTDLTPVQLFRKAQASQESAATASDASTTRSVPAEPRRSGFDASQNSIRPPEAERASSNRYSCRSACARAADRLGNKPAKIGRSLGHRIPAAVQIRAGQKPHQCQPTPSVEQGARCACHVLFRGHRGNRCDESTRSHSGPTRRWAQQSWIQ